MDFSLLTGQLRGGLPAALRSAMDPQRPDYEADFANEAAGTKVAGHVFCSGAMERREMVLDGGPMQLKAVCILRPDKDAAWVVLPTLGTYTELGIQTEGSEGQAGADWQLDTEDKGRTAMEGHPVTKREVSGHDSAGNSLRATQWMTDHGIALRTEVSVQGPSVGGQEEIKSVEQLSNLKVGPVDKSLFELPDGLTETPIPSAEAMQKLLSPVEELSDKRR